MNKDRIFLFLDLFALIFGIMAFITVGVMIIHFSYISSHVPLYIQVCGYIGGIIFLGISIIYGFAARYVLDKLKEKDEETS